jgi:hypothetical protein
MSAAFMLFGLSLVYGLSGEINLIQIAGNLQKPPLDPLLIVALVMVMIGFGFKIAAVPFHLWAPDAYQGAPTPSAAFIASGSKVASFFILAKVMMVGFLGQEGSGAWRGFSQGWLPLIAIIATASILLGNLAAIAQTSVRRLLAYSAIAQAGYILIGLLANNKQGMESLVFYTTTYALTVLGAFGVVNIVQERSGDEKFSAFAGLAKRAPLLSFCMMVFMLSLAGYLRHRDERRLALLLSPSAQTDLREPRARRCSGNPVHDSDTDGDCPARFWSIAVWLRTKPSARENHHSGGKSRNIPPLTAKWARTHAANDQRDTKCDRLTQTVDPLFSMLPSGGVCGFS